MEVFFPFLDFKNGEYDKNYLKSPDIYTVLLCEKHNKIVNYILVFEDSINSPMESMPIKKEFLKNTAYIGSAFTVPKERGFGVMVFGILHAISYLIENTEHKKAILAAHSTTPGAKHFFQRLGFKIIHDAAPNNLSQWILYKFSMLLPSIK
jgi:GNAT superfamily N-acetyltransferase